MLRRPSETIIADLKAPFRPQREWAQRRGLLLILAFFASGIGAGGWVFALFTEWPTGLRWSLGVVLVLSGGAHMAFLGQPARFWRAISRPQTSWISRGIWGIGFFTVTGLIYLATGAEPWATASAFDRLWIVLSTVGAVWILTYKGFVFAFAKGVPFWNTSIMPALFFSAGLRGGAALVLLLATLGGSPPELHTLEIAKLWVTLSSAALLVFYLWAVSQGASAARRSVEELVRGRVRLAFYLGVVAIGLALPLVWSVVGLYNELEDWAWVVIAATSLLGDLYLTYAIAKAGVHPQVAPPSVLASAIRATRNV